MGGDTIAIRHGSVIDAVIAILAIAGSLIPPMVHAANHYVEGEHVQGAFPLVAQGQAARLFVPAAESAGVRRVVRHLQADIERITGVRPALQSPDVVVDGPLVIIGTIGQGPVIDGLVAEGKIDAAGVTGVWDAFALQTVDNPFPGVDRALVVFGGNKRGTIYGMYDLAEQAGVSPWYWWADVPVQRKPELYVRAGRHSPGAPKVKYRGIFINDEAPALTDWAKDTFGGFNSAFYEKVYELILRNRGNYLWPAMWRPSAFYVDDPENARLADELGVIIATTHHEPMMRAHDEWHRADNGPWNYETNAERLREFWRGGIERMGGYESVVTVGMRGDGDEAMSEDTAIELMQRIIRDQREIIADVTGRPAGETPQVWALYKEMQDYWDRGMRVPDDVLVLLCDDNWGNVRMLPEPEERDRAGGFGMYYHFDFVGGPVSYRWINVTQIEKVWEQMNLSWAWGVRDLWLVNVGDIKPMELPISFFLDMAWDPEAIEAVDLPRYYVDWAAQQFGDEYAEEIAGILALATKYSARRTPEMIKPDTWSLTNYREADRILGEYGQLVARARDIYAALPAGYRSAFYQLVLFPVEISANLNRMYVAAGRNRLYAEQGRGSANHYAERVREYFERDANLTRAYHEELEGGKWNHMMSQTHIGYTSWDNPPENVMPEVVYVEPGETAGIGIAVEHGTAAGNAGGDAAWMMPAFDPVNDANYYVEVYNTGRGAFEYTIDAEEEWIRLLLPGKSMSNDERVLVAIDWEKAPAGDSEGTIVIGGGGNHFTVRVPIRTELPRVAGFAENNGVVSIEADHFMRAVGADGVDWAIVPNLGRTGSSVTVEPANADRRTPGDDAPYLEYEFTVFDPGELTIEAYLSPTLNYKKNEGLKYAIAIDGAPPRIVNIHEGEAVPDWEYPERWNESVTDHVRKSRTSHRVTEAGPHTLRVRRVDPGVVFRKFVIDAGGLRDSYLGPPESTRPADR